jgi:formylglycine-generating enzyme required for sulfatase activity
MKSPFLIAVVSLVLLAQPVLSQNANLPLTKDQVISLVKFGMDSGELAKRIKEHGIDFEPSDDYIHALRNMGVQEAVIQALREARPKPLTAEQVGKLVAGGVPSQRALMLVKQHGIDFIADDQYLETLRLAGADEELIASLREANKSVTAQLTVVTSPFAEVYLDGEPVGKAGPEGYLAMEVKAGGHKLKVSLKGKKDLAQGITLAAPQGTRIEAPLENLPVQVRENPKDGLKYAWIWEGTFIMGCRPGDNVPGEESHQVTISRGFWIGQTPVTGGAFQRFLGATGRQKPVYAYWGTEHMPVEHVSWDVAQAFCGWMGGRLPTEAEWEYAAKAGDRGGWWAGDLIDCYGNCKDPAHEVAKYPANAFGLYDTLDNVWEWVNDWYDPNYYRRSPSQDPEGPESGTEHAVRGWSIWGGHKPYNLSSRMHFSGQEWPTGFRCVWEEGGP